MIQRNEENELAQQLEKVALNRTSRSKTSTPLNELFMISNAMTGMGITIVFVIICI